MDFETMSLFHIGIPLFLLFGAAQFGICFVRRNGLRKALRAIAFLPIAAAAVCAAPPGRTTAQRGFLRPLLFRGEYAILKPADGNQRSFGSTRYDDKHVEKENLL